jgi:hypothetical protein
MPIAILNKTLQYNKSWYFVDDVQDKFPEVGTALA